LGSRPSRFSIDAVVEDVVEDRFRMMLLFKRKFLKIDEKLNPGDLQHATLTYRQALWDYLHYPVAEDVTLVSAVAASILLVEYDHYKTYVESGRIEDPAILQEMVPEVSLRDRNFKRWSVQILSLLQQLQASVDPSESRLLGMSRVLSLCQKMKLFGAYYWSGRQIASASAAEAPIPEAPRMNCVINPKQPEAEFWICVDLFGVRFVSGSNQPGRSFQRGFLFSDESVERIYCCSAKKNIVQFVVKTVNPANPSAGQVPQTISMRSPAAVDAAFCINVIQAMMQV